MIIRNYVLGIATAAIILFTSCQKDVMVKDDESASAQVSSDAAADDVVETAAPVYSSVVANVNSDVAGFMQAVPARYSLTTKKYPLIVFIHGIGELGTDLKLNCCGLPHHLYNKSFPANFNVGGVNYSFLVIAPQFKVRPTAAQVQSVIEYAKKRWRVDDTRIYVTGLSMGGGSTWDWAAEFGSTAAAIVPVCGGTKPTTSMAASIAAKNIPIWGLYSSSDEVVPIQWGKDFFSWIDAKNTTYASRTKLTIWSGLTHNSTWGKAFNPTTVVDGYNIYQWMLLNKKGTAATVPTTPVQTPTTPTTPTTTNKVPVANAGADQTISLASGINRVTLEGATSTDPDGTISKYVWTKISGPECTMVVRNNTSTWAAHMLKGTYQFRLTVTDNSGATDTDDITVTVN